MTAAVEAHRCEPVAQEVARKVGLDTIYVLETVEVLAFDGLSRGKLLAVD